MIEGARIYLANEILLNKIDPFVLLLKYGNTTNTTEVLEIHHQILRMALLHCIIDQFAPMKALAAEQKQEEAHCATPIPEKNLTIYLWILLKSCREL